MFCCLKGQCSSKDDILSRYHDWLWQNYTKEEKERYLQLMSQELKRRVAGEPSVVGDLFLDTDKKIHVMSLSGDASLDTMDKDPDGELAVIPGTRQTSPKRGASHNDIFFVFRALHALRIIMMRCDRIGSQSFLLFVFTCRDLSVQRVGLTSGPDWRTQGCEGLWKTADNGNIQTIYHLKTGPYGGFLSDKAELRKVDFQTGQVTGPNLLSDLSDPTNYHNGGFCRMREGDNEAVCPDDIDDDVSIGQESQLIICDYDMAKIKEASARGIQRTAEQRKKSISGCVRRVFRASFPDLNPEENERFATLQRENGDDRRFRWWKVEDMYDEPARLFQNKDIMLDLVKLDGRVPKSLIKEVLDATERIWSKLFFRPRKVFVDIGTGCENIAWQEVLLKCGYVVSLDKMRESNCSSLIFERLEELPFRGEAAMPPPLPPPLGEAPPLGGAPPLGEADGLPGGGERAAEV